MCGLIITDRLGKQLNHLQGELYFLALRPLKVAETSFVKSCGIKRYYLPTLTDQESSSFFQEFDRFWDQLVKPFPETHQFWRNCVSSKMQEWEHSSAYLALILFVLTCRRKELPFHLIIITSNITEEQLFLDWGLENGYPIKCVHALTKPNWVRKILQEGLNIRNFVYVSLIYIYKKWISPKITIQPLNSSKTILISSLLYPNSWPDNSYRDPFFGKIHTDLKVNGGYNVIFLCDALAGFRKAVALSEQDTTSTVYFPESLISLSELLALLWQQLTKKLKIGEVLFGGVDFSMLIGWNYRRTYGSFNFGAEVYFRAIGNLMKQYSFSNLIQLYEGNVFERGCIQAFRQKSAAPVIGYAHGVIYPINLKLRFSNIDLKQQPQPDYYACLGEENKSLLKDIGRRQSSRVRAGCTWRAIPNQGNSEDIEKTEKIVLVALDGVRSTIAIIDWLFEYSGELSEFRFLLRAHPNVPIKSLLSQTLFDKPANFEFSLSSLNDDFRKCFCVIYRQSSVGAQAILNGVPAIHLAIDTPLSCDPLMRVKNVKKVRIVRELQQELQFLLGLGENEKLDHLKDAVVYINDYFMPPNTENLLHFLP
jgi:hypothetical protein